MDLTLIIQRLRNRKTKLDAIILSLDALRDAGPSHLAFGPKRYGYGKMEAKARKLLPRRKKMQE